METSFKDPVDFWKQNPSVLLDTQKFKEFVPSESMSFNQKLNAMTRFVIYFSIILYVISGRFETFFLLLVGLGLIYIMHDYKIDVNVTLKNKEQFKIREGFTDKPIKGHNKENLKSSQVDRIVQNITHITRSDSLLPSDLFDSQDQSKHTTEGLNFRYSSENKKQDSHSGNSVSENKQANIPEGNTDRSNIIPFSASGLASVDAVRDAFTNASQTNPFQGSIQQTGGGCNTCAPSNSPFSPPTCNKGGSTSLDGNSSICQMPTPDNPFMNVMVTDYANNPNKLPACNPEIVKNDMNNMWSQNLYRNVNDVWDKNNNQMRFSTENWTTNPNDRDAYQKWLYNIPYVCKDGDLGACYRGAELQMGQMRPGKIF